MLPTRDDLMSHTEDLKAHGTANAAATNTLLTEGFSAADRQRQVRQRGGDLPFLHEASFYFTQFLYFTTYLYFTLSPGDVCR